MSRLEWAIVYTLTAIIVISLVMVLDLGVG